MKEGLMTVKRLKEELDRFEEHKTIVLMIDGLWYGIEPNVFRAVFRLGDVDSDGIELRVGDEI